MKKKCLNEWAADIHENAVKHGWWDEERSFGEIVALCHSELSEALEEVRNKRPLFWFERQDSISASFGEHDTDICTDIRLLKGEKPEGIAVEMIDCLIRILDWCGKEGVDIDAILSVKHAYNKTRPYRHGNKAL